MQNPCGKSTSKTIPSGHYEGDGHAMIMQATATLSCGHQVMFSRARSPLAVVFGVSWSSCWSSVGRLLGPVREISHHLNAGRP